MKTPRVLSSAFSYGESGIHMLIKKDLIFPTKIKVDTHTLTQRSCFSKFK